MFRVGDYAFWNDPDNHLCDTSGHIIEIKGCTDDPVYVIDIEGGDVVEAFSGELQAADPDLIRARRDNGR